MTRHATPLSVPQLIRKLKTIFELEIDQALPDDYKPENYSLKILRWLKAVSSS